ncbi:MAG TPA: adenylate/guanylate cyclase domain-containing protein [Anaerolineaceae bacterium]
MKCPNCGFDSSPEMKFCGMCGLRLMRVCPHCAFGNPGGYHFCGNCGSPLAEEDIALEAAGKAAAGIPVADKRALARMPVAAPLPVVEEALIEPSPTEIKLEGERRVVTVILTDLTGSTNLLEKVGTETWVEMMNRILHILESEIYRFGGEVDQFRGDGLVAFFGASTAHEDDAERAVHAALSMQRAMKHYGKDLIKEDGIDLQLRVGVNTGEVIVANVGDRRRHSEDTAMGVAVAIAARMESAAESGTVLVTEDTYSLAESQFKWLPLGEIMVKGISHPIAVFRPLTPLENADQGHTIEAMGYSIPLIDRDVEFQSIKSCVEDLFDGRGRIIMLTGDKGMGKSFLVNEVCQYFARQNSLLAEAQNRNVPSSRTVTWFRGRCRSYDQSWPYSMWIDLLLSWIGIRQDEPKETTRDRLYQKSKELWGNHLVEHYPYFATFLSLPLEESFSERVRHLDAEGLRQQFFLTMRSWLELMAHRGPMVVIFSDMQCVDTSSLDLLKYCLPLVDNEALLFLLLLRPERTSPAWDFRHYVETEYPHRVISLTVTPLSEAQSSAYIDLRLGPAVLPEETRGLIIKTAEGNPYYIQELIHSLIINGLLVQDGENGKWHTTRAVTSLDLPSSLQRLLLARIGQLSPEERFTLQIAAVTGPVFWLNVLQSLAGQDFPVRTCLTALQRDQLIDETGRFPELGMQYTFKSTLIRDAAYESLLVNQRSTYHLKVAEFLESLFNPEDLARYFGMLAYHYQGAGETKKELFYTLQAGEQAKRIYANVEANDRFTHALKLLDHLQTQTTDADQLYAIKAQRFEIFNERREVLNLLGDFKASETDAGALLHLAHQLEDDPVWMVDALLQQPGVVSWRSREELKAGIPMAKQALELAQKLGDQRREVLCLMAICRQLLFENDPAIREIGERAITLARQIGDKEMEVNLLIEMGTSLAWSNQPELGMKFLEDALSASRELSDKRHEMALLYLMGLGVERQGDYYRCLTEFFQKRLQISREIGDHPVEGDALMTCGQIMGIYLGDQDTGLLLLEECLRILEDTETVALIHIRMAQLQTEQGSFEDAQATLERVAEFNENNFLTMWRAGYRLVMAKLLIARGSQPELYAAIDRANEVIHLSEEHPELSRQYKMAACCKLTLAHLKLADFVEDQAERGSIIHETLAFTQTALDIHNQFGFVQIVESLSEEIFFLRSLALEANHQADEAAGYLEKAYEEMMRKHDLIPADSLLRDSYLENISVHRNIAEAYKKHMGLADEE